MEKIPFHKFPVPPEGGWELCNCLGKTLRIKTKGRSFDLLPLYPTVSLNPSAGSRRMVEVRYLGMHPSPQADGSEQLVQLRTTISMSSWASAAVPLLLSVPEPCPGKLYVVTNLVRVRMPQRFDLVSPMHPQVYPEIITCPALAWGIL